MSSDEEDSDCPLCMEELDIADRNFRPCPCGYQICRFCWHHIKTNLNGRCPACRRLYSDQIVEFVPVSAEEIMRLKKEKKEKDRQTRDMRDPSRRQLSNIRVVQKNLVYVLGLSSKHASVDNEFFKKYGRIDKVVISKRSAPSSGSNSSVGVYVTFARKEDAGRAIEGINGMELDGKTIRASYGTTKYCTYYLRHMACPNPNCMYLHEPGDDVDSYSKDTVAIGKHANTASTSTTTSAYPNKRPATVTKTATPATTAAATTGTPEPKPATVPRTWAPIPKVVPIPPVIVPKEEPAAVTAPGSPAVLKENIKPTASFTANNKPTKPIASASTSTKSPSSAAKSNKKASLTEKNNVAKKTMMEEDEKPALPATASWAKAQPIVNAHESVITPANFGPSLSDALNAAQKPKHSPSLKVKKEKKSKGKMVRLEEFEEAEREAKMAAARPKVVPKPAPVAIPKPQPQEDVQVNKEQPIVEAPKPSVAEIVKEQEEDVVMTEESEPKEAVMEEEMPVEIEVVPEMVEIKKSGSPAIVITVNTESQEEEVKGAEEPIQLDQPDLVTNEIITDKSEIDEMDKEDQVPEQESSEIDNEQADNLASLNEDVIKAFGDAAAAAAAVDESSEKILQADDQQEQILEEATEDLKEEIENLNQQIISSPMAAMDRLSALVQQEIMTDSPEQQQQLQQPPQQQQQQQQPGFDMAQQPVRFDMGLPMQQQQQEGANRRMAPPGLGGPPPPPPDWLNRGSFDPFNGQDPSLIAARRLQHSQRMLEASGLFGGAGFGHPPVVPRFGFSPNPNNGFLPPQPPHHHHQRNPPPPPHHPSMGMFPPPPHPHHPMMRPHPPPPSVDMMNVQNSPFGPLHTQHPNMQMDDLRNEFNSMKMNGGQDHQQSRDDFRALLPNVNISFNNLQEKRRAEEFYQQQLIMQRQQQQMQLQQRLSEQQQQKDQIPIHMDSNNSPMMRNSFTDASPRAQEKVLLKSPLNQQQTEPGNPDVRVEAQNFFGEFLRKAASSTQQQQDMSPKKEEPATSLPFQDPAIMSVRLVDNEVKNNNDIVRSQNTILQILGGQTPPPPSQQQQQQQQHQQHQQMLSLEQQQQMHMHQQQQMHQRQMDPRFNMDFNNQQQQQGRMFNDMASKQFNNNSNSNNNTMFMGPPQNLNFQQQQQQQFHQQGPPPQSSFMTGFREPPPMGMMGRMPPPPPPPGMMRQPMPPLLNDMRFRGNGLPPGMFTSNTEEGRHQ